MKNWIYILFASAFLFSCNENDADGSENETESAEEILSSIQEIDDSLKVLIQKRMEIDTFKIDKLVYHEAINRNKKLYRLYPEHEKAEEALQNIASLYMQIGVESEAAKWRDSILLHYPNNEYKMGLLELQMNYYDYDNYDPAKIEYYIEELLKLENLSEEKRADYKFRLKHIDKTFDELIEIRMKEADSIAKEEEAQNT